MAAILYNLYDHPGLEGTPCALPFPSLASLRTRSSSGSDANIYLRESVDSDCEMSFFAQSFHREFISSPSYVSPLCEHEC
jgi:hypothetical protein